jgi:Mn2+/Fe2+ NRAMP family transporter
MRTGMMFAAALAIAVLAAGGLSGCGYARQATAFAEGNVNEAIQIKRRQSDVEARAVVNMPCITTVGSFFRELNDREKLGVALICSNPGVSPETIRRALGQTE